MYSHPQHGAGNEAQKLRKEAGVWLKSMREAAGLSQRELAARIKVDYYTFVSQIESGRGRVPPDRYAAWAEALGIDIQDFVRRLMRYYDPVTHSLLFPDNGEA